MRDSPPYTQGETMINIDHVIASWIIFIILLFVTAFLCQKRAERKSYYKAKESMELVLNFLVIHADTATSVRERRQLKKDLNYELRKAFNIR